MKFLKNYLLLASIMLFANLLPAQDYDYLSKVRQYLAEGNCEGAQTYYNLALQFQLNNRRDNDLEQQIADCESEEANVGDLTFTVKGVTFTMKYVEGGTFQMGGNDSESDNNEMPIHTVTLSSYYICETEVTQALWKAVMGNNPSYFKGDNLPVEQVSWNDCQDFIRELNRMTGKNFCLPTEAEWEYAARGGNRSNGYKYAGSNIIGNVAWYTDNSNRQTHIVRTKSPNELGLYDMSGNVYEWCQDWYGNYSSGSQTNPQGPSSGSRHVLRGGSWACYAKCCRVSNRNNYVPDRRSYYLGFRLCLPQQDESNPESETTTIRTERRTRIIISGDPDDVIRATNIILQGK